MKELRLKGYDKMIETYRDKPDEIIEILLEYHDVKKLKAILNGKERKKERKGNSYFVIAIDVYLTQYHNESKLEWAIDKVAAKNNISDKTTKNHITKFRKTIKKNIEKFLHEYSGYHPAKTKDVSTFINDFMSRIYPELVDRNGNFYNVDRPSEKYKELLKQYMHEINRIASADEIPF